MAGKLNQVAVQDYAEQFAQAVCDKHFSTHAEVRGGQIMNLTPTRQLNLLVIKNLFERWQEETENVKSPYFNYEVPEIVEAMETLMNLLSKNISVKRVYFEPLLSEATEDTLKLLLAPFLFYQATFERYGMRFHVQDDFRASTKYIKTHTKLLTKIIEKLDLASDTEGYIEVAEAVDIAKEVIKNNLEYDDPKPALREFHQTKSLRLQDLVAKPEEKEKSHQTFTPSPAPEPNNFREPTPSRETAYSGNTLNTSDTGEENTPKTVHETLLEKAPPAKPTVLERQQKHAGESLETLIPLNMKMAFVDELFKGDRAIFDEVVNKIDHCATYHEAIMYIRENYFYKYDWSLENSEVQEFYSIIEKKFD